MSVLASEVQALQDRCDAAVAAVERIAKALGVADADDFDAVVAAVEHLAGEPANAVAAPSMTRMTKTELLAAQKAGARVSFDEVPADASCTVDGAPVVLVADDLKAVR